VDRNDRKVASSWSPFEVMFTSDDIVHWLIDWSMNNWSQRAILLKAPEIEVSGLANL
jgi:hypothetical protein